MTAIGFLFACSWKAALLVGLGAVLLRMWPRASAAERHAAWAAVIVSLLALPILSLLWGVVPFPIENAPAKHAFAAADGHTVIRVFGGEEIDAAIGTLEDGFALIMLVWAMGAAAALARTALGHARARRYLRNAVVFEPDLSAWARRRGGALHFPVLLTPRAAMPMVIGFFNPRIVLPANAPGWPPGQLCRVLLHESAHLERRDPAWKLIASFVSALYWFHPFVWLALRQLASQREQACDDMVLAAGGRPSRYARDLLEFARNALQKRIPEAAIPMASPTRLEARVAAILDETRPRQTLRRSNMTAYSCTLALLLGPLSALTSVAQPPPPPNVPRADFNGSLGALRELTAQHPALAGLSAQAAPARLARDTKAAARIGEAPQPAIAPATAAASPVAKPVVAAQEERPSRIRVGGGVQQAKLIKQVKPVYPADAKAEGVEGLVRLNVRIDKEGLVAETEVEKSPDTRLAEAAVEAVSQWVYAPTLLNGDPVEVLTVVDVNFTLQK
ncbi:MAG: TonB family protein [Bryobacterales bacterium]|nr:TonB family protein [Bryobacterales bacterium]